MDDLTAASLEDVQAFFRTHYSPSNCVISIVGDVTPEAAVAGVERFFGGIPTGPGPQPARVAPVLAPLPAGVREEVPDPNVPAEAVYLGYRAPAEGDEALAAFEVAEAVLASGRGSAFTRSLVRAELAQQAGFFVDRRRSGASLAVAVGHARADVPIETVEKALLDEIDRVATEGPSAEELERAKAMVERAYLDQLATVDGRADFLSYAATVHGDPRVVEGWLEPMLATTAAQVRDVVATHLASAHPAAVVFRPTTEDAA
jgi:predicted Zn-dependent peptidase